MAIAFVQEKDALGNNVPYNGTNVTLTSSVGSGNLLVAVVYWILSGTPINITDTQGNTWSAATSAAETANYNRVRMYYAYASASGSLTVSVGSAGVNSNENIELVVLEYSGVNGAAPEANVSDINAGNNAPITTVSDHSLIVAANSSTAAQTAGTGYTARYTGSPIDFEIVVDKVDATPAGTFSGEFSGGGTQAKVAASFAPTASTAAIKRILTLGAG